MGSRLSTLHHGLGIVPDLDAHTYNWMSLIRTGDYFHPYPVESVTTFTMVADVIYALPFFVARNLTIDRLRLEVTAEVAGKIARLGIYANGTNLYPGALVVDAGTVSVNAVAVVAATISESLTKGLYWIVIASDDTPTIRSAITSWPMLGQGTSHLTAYGRWGWMKAAVGSGALADLFATGASVTGSSLPHILPRLLTLD